MDAICEEIGVGIQHFIEIKPGRYRFVCDELTQITWLQTLLCRQKIGKFVSSKELSKNSHSLLSNSLDHPWTQLLVQTYSKQPQLKVFPLPISSNEEDQQKPHTGASMPLTYSQAVSYVNVKNFRKLWESAFKRYSESHIKFCKQGSSHYTKHTDCKLLPYDVVLKELIQRIFQCPILNCKLDRLGNDEESISDKVEQKSTGFMPGNNIPNLLPAMVAIETSTHFCVFFYPPIPTATLHDCIAYSPAVLGKSYNKSLFILYQICKLSNTLQSMGLFLGDIRLHDILLGENLWLQILPHLDSNMLLQPHFQLITTPSDSAAAAFPDQRTPSIGGDCSASVDIKFDLKFAYDLDQFSLREYCEMWCNGQLSNFDYLTILNNAAGRSLKDPSHYHIMPWVTDFTARNGANWRDLTRSKYRLNKGDDHLDLMYAAGSNQQPSSTDNPLGTREVAHHVSDFLSEITYFVYMARRTPQKVLCDHVRPIWVPAEYPVSITRLQAWSPDECIPEFYTDPLIFKSIHEDLPDLELPVWASCPEDFICKHREALESQYVSERLQHWIDLNFGYKLNGKAAVKSKNVCLSLVDQHRNLTTTGILQLFTQPHPPKRFPSPWFMEVPPRLSLHNYQSSPNTKTSSSSSSTRSRNRISSHEVSKRLAKSTENINTATTSIKSSSPCSRSAVQANAAALTNTDETNGTTSTSNFYNTTNFIELPKDFNPIALLQSLETQQNFFARTFPNQKPVVNAHDKIVTNDLMFEENSESYTNQLFANETGIASEHLKAGKSKNLLTPCINTLKKQMLDNMLHERQERELQIIGCLIVELFLLQRLRPLLMNGMSASFEERLKACRIVATQYRLELPKCVRNAVNLLLSPMESDNVITDKGLPRPTAAQLLEPIFANSLLPFPDNYPRTFALIRSLYAFDLDASLLELQTHFNCNGKECGRYAKIDRARVLFSRKIAECKVMSCCAHIVNLMDPIAYEQFPSIELLLPHFVDLLNDENTSILTAWNLFDQMAQALGISGTQTHLLMPLMKLYDVESFERGMHSLRARTIALNNSHLRFSTSSSFKSRKSVKLYHHSFLLRLIVRFGLRCFLQNFITPLIEAVGGFKEPEEGTGFHYHSGSGSTSRRTSKNLNYANSIANDDNPSSATFTEGQQTIADRGSLSMKVGKEEIEDVFTFEDDINTDYASNSGTAENKSIDSFDIRPATAEEAQEETTTTPEKLSITDIICDSKLSNVSFEEASDGADSNAAAERISLHSQTASIGEGSEEALAGNILEGPKSPTIAIPTINLFNRSYQLNAIDCDIGSRRSVDSFEIITQAAADEEAQRTKLQNQITITVDMNNTSGQLGLESQDSLQASVISKMSEAKQAQNNRIAEMSSESLVWLSHRLGAVLTSRYITRNLLKMLSLCYVGQENLLPELNCDTQEDLSGNLNYFSIADARVVGDKSASRVLECLMSIAALYGEQFILLQYLPHIGELVSMGAKRLTNSLEGAIISALQLLKYLVPCLTDVTLMDRMKDIILESILLPILRLLSSTRLLMPNGYLGRSVLARKFLDAVYVLCVRIGSDMSKEHLCMPVIRPFFLIFDKAYGNVKNFANFIQDKRSITPPTNDERTQKANVRESEELRDVFGPALAHIAYLSFLRFLGESIMQRTLLNFEFILILCHEFEQPSYQSSPYQRATHIGSDAVDCPTSPESNSNQGEAEVFAANSFGTQLVGNRIEVVSSSSSDQQQDRQLTLPQALQTQNVDPMDVLNMVAYKFDQVSNSRHLKGNWLAYWRHETTRADSDSKLSLKQIKLQSFVGHTNSIRNIIALDNENSFISASKDKTVKLWSLRSEGDGSKITPCQFTYTAHKKSINSLAFLDAMRFVVSCDSGVHIWDPFIGRPLGILDSHKHNPVTVVKCLPSPSPLVIAGTAEASVKVIDSRCMQYVNEWRLAPTSQSTVRCLTASPSGNWLAAGLSNGSIVMLDTRTGVVLNAWRPMECDLLQLAAPNEHQLISSSLDHSLAVWHANDGILHYQLRPPAEPAHYLQTIGSELVFATTGNRIGLYTDLNSSHAAYTVTKLRSETFRGVLTSLAVLPLNRVFLAGNESGNIVLLC